MLINPYIYTNVIPVDGERVMSSYSVLKRRNTAVGTRTPNGIWTTAGNANSSGAGLTVDMDMYAVVAFDNLPGDGAITVDIDGDYNGSPQTDTLTITTPDRYAIGTLPFTNIDTVTVTASDFGADGFFSAGAMIRVSSGNTGYDALTWDGAIDSDVQLNVGASPLSFNGALADTSQSDGTPVDFSGLGLSGTTIFIRKTANSAARDLDIQGTPNDETVSLASGSGTTVTGTEELTSLDDIVVTSGTSSAPFAAIGIITRALSTWPS